MRDPLRCSICGNEIESPEDLQYIDKKPVCADCYFERFNEEIEKHPIVSPQLIIDRRRRRN